MREGNAAFVPTARLLKLLGGELIRDDVMAVMELIKNSYDADATEVRITVNAEDAESGFITVQDNGTGIGTEDLLSRWMQPGGSFKRRQKRTPLGRRMLGEKGVGRFAVDRLGRRCTLISRKQDSDREIVAVFDWDRFVDETVPLSEVGSAWREREPELFLKGHGTRIEIEQLRQSWARRDFRRLSGKIDRMRSPFARQDGFDIELLSDDYPDYSGENTADFLAAAPYQLHAVFDGLETMNVTFNGVSEAVTLPGSDRISCGPLGIRMHAYDLDTEGLRKAGGVLTLRGWLRNWSGCSVYRDGFRVLPYGEPDDDWLRLDQRRVNNPVLRLGTRQVVGQVELTSDANPELTDQTNRGGLVDNQASSDMRSLVLFVVDWLEERRYRLRHDSFESEEAVGSTCRASATDGDDGVEAAIRSVRQQSRSVSQKAGVAVGPLIDVVARAYRQEVKDRVKASVGLDEQAAAGLSTGLVAHEIHKTANELERLLEKSTQAGHFDTDTRYEINRLAAQIKDFSKLSLSFSSGVSYQNGEIDLRKELPDFIQTMTPLAARYGVAMREFEPLTLDQLPLVQGGKDTLWRILGILVRNAIEACSNVTKPEIRITAQRARSDSGFVNIRCMDNGPGVAPEYMNEMFLAGVSSKDGQSGFGLTVARSLARRISKSDESRTGNIIHFSNNFRKYWTVFEVSLPVFRD